jgi:hypothetical protein
MIAEHGEIHSRQLDASGLHEQCTHSSVLANRFDLCLVVDTARAGWWRRVEAKITSPACGRAAAAGGHRGSATVSSRAARRHRSCLQKTSDLVGGSCRLRSAAEQEQQHLQLVHTWML